MKQCLEWALAIFTMPTKWYWQKFSSGKTTTAIMVPLYGALKPLECLLQSSSVMALTWDSTFIDFLDDVAMRCDAMRNRRDFVSIPYYTIPYVPILAQIYGLNYGPAEWVPQFQFQFWIRFRFRFRLRFLGSANAVKIMVMVATRESRNFMIIWRGQPNISRMLMALSRVIAD